MLSVLAESACFSENGTLCSFSSLTESDVVFVFRDGREFSVVCEWVSVVG